MLHFFIFPKITGTVTSAGKPIAGASVVASPSGKGTTTDETGNYNLSLSAGNYTINISSLGMDAQSFKISLAAGETKTQNAMMQASFISVNDVVVVGSRGVGRIRTESAVPVDVIGVNQAQQTTAKSDLSSILNVSAPSFNFNKQSGADGSDAMDLASLRGLSPDHTLVLINGKRQHQTAFIAQFGTRGRGGSGTDLNAIPEASIDRVEILRDGASAQYGSDAIAGVINIILKKDVNKLSVNTGFSGYLDHANNALNQGDKTQYYTGSQMDGVAGTLAVNYGVPLGDKGGFINVSGNFLTQGKTYRQAADNSALGINSGRRAFGDASVVSGGGMYNLSLPVGAGKTSFYSFGGYNKKTSNAYAYTRNFSRSPARYPTSDLTKLNAISFLKHTSSGDIFYNPIEIANIADYNFSMGLKGSFSNGWDWDVSNTLGNNDFHYWGDKTFNASLNDAGINRNHFDDGGFSFLQNTLNAGVSKRFGTSTHGANLAFGAELRNEQYKIYAGEEASYKNYDLTKGTGAQGFPGFQPADVVNATRSNLGLYADLEMDITSKFLVDAATRFEHYSDFGDLATFKFASRYKISPNFNLRGSVSTGFRAPSLQQINFGSTFTTVQGGKISEVKIAPNTSPITRAAGIPNLKQETSVNSSIGFAWKLAKGFNISMDGYLVSIKDRIVLSGQFDASIPALTNILNSLNVSSAQFFTNAVNTTNVGVDIVANYNTSWGSNSFKALLAGNFQHMTINQVNVPNKLISQPDVFFGVREQQFVLASAPPQKVSLNLEYGCHQLAFGTHFTYYGKILLSGYSGMVPLDNDPNTYVPENYLMSGKTVTDIYGSYKFNKNATLFIGADNVFNIHPDLAITPGAVGASAYDTEAGGAWESVQMGFNGIRLFAKLGLNF